MIEKQENELKNIKEENVKHVDKKENLTLDIEKQTKTAIDLDEKIFTIILKDEDKYKKIFNCNPMNEKKE